MMKPPRRTYVGAYAICLDPAGRILLCRLSKECVEAGAWTLPGGGIEWGESPKEAVLRELEEETGLKPSTAPIVCATFSAIYPALEGDTRGPLHYLGILFEIPEVEGSLRAEPCGSTDLCAWFTQKEACELRLTALGRRALDIARISPSF